MILWKEGKRVPHDGLPLGHCGCHRYWRRDSKTGKMTGGWCDCRSRRAKELNLKPRGSDDSRN